MGRKVITDYLRREASAKAYRFAYPLGRSLSFRTDYLDVLKMTSINVTVLMTTRCLLHDRNSNYF
ncbi:MAG: hypothetical protein RLZZ171_2512 [Cyanobacteriota bacterium]|jgi:hypothetical protein